MATALAILQALIALAGLVRSIMSATQSAKDRQAGRDDVTAEVNSETLETQDAMDSVARPSDDAVADSLRSGKF